MSGFLRRPREGDHALACPHCGNEVAYHHDPLSPQQFRILTYLDEHIREYGFAPSYDEIAGHFLFASLATVHEHLENMDRKGVIARAYNEARAIRILVRPDELDSRRLTAGRVRPIAPTQPDQSRPIRWVKPLSATATAIRERPILFSAPMVRAILDGKKTQTRRVVRIAPKFELTRPSIGGGVWRLPTGPDTNVGFAGYPDAPPPELFTALVRRSPYGAVGDRLWVRETAWYDRQVIPVLGYRRAFFEGGDMRRENANGGESGRQPGADKGWNDSYTAELYALNDSLVRRPSIHMPRWASRITLEITDVRVERVQEITGNDSVSEGIDVPGLGAGSTRVRCVERYRELWDSLNAARNGGAYSWDRNPWVWVLEFRRAAT